MCIHNKPVGCLAGPSLSPPDSKVIRPLSGRCLRPPATASHFAPRRLSIFVGLDGEYLEPFCKAERRASSPSPSLPGSGYDSSAGCCLDPDASRGPLSRAARARAPASRARTWLRRTQPGRGWLSCSAALCTCRAACRQACRQVGRVRDAGWWLVRARDTTTNNSTTASSPTFPLQQLPLSLFSSQLHSSARCRR